MKGWTEALGSFGPRAFGFVLLGVFMAACPGQRAPGSMGLVMRFADPPPQKPFQRERVIQDLPAFDWSLEDLGVEARWMQPEADRSVSVAGTSANLSWRDDRLTFARPVGFASDSVDRIDVVVASLNPETTRTGDVALYWTVAGTDGEGEPLLVEAGEPFGEDRRLYRLWVRGEPGWANNITGLRLVCVMPQQAQAAHIRVVRVTGYREAVLSEPLAELAQSGIQIALEGQTRVAFPALPGYPVERNVDIPDQAELRFGYGLQPGVRVPVKLLIRLEGKTSEELFSIRLDPGQKRERGWQDGVVDLTAYAGQQVRLVLETEASSALGPSQGMALWGNPEVLAPRLGELPGAPG